MNDLTFQETARFLKLMDTAARRLAEDTRFHPGNIETTMNYLKDGQFDMAMNYSKQIAATILFKAGELGCGTSSGNGVMAKVKIYLAQTGAVWSLVS